MTLRMGFVITTILLFANLVLAGDFQPPKQTLVVPDKPIPIGELVKLSTSPIQETPKSFQSATYTWTVLDGYKEVKVENCGEGIIHFGTGARPKKLLVLCACTYLFADKDPTGVVKEAGTRTVILRAEVQIGEAGPDPGPGPDPLPPSFPDGKFGLAKFSYDTAMKEVRPDTRAKAAQALKKSFEGIASAIGAGAIKSNEDALKKAKDANDAALKDAGIPLEEWDGFGVALQARLYKDYQGKKLNVPADFADAYREIAIGLGGVK